jgi:hypothetical protein
MGTKERFLKLVDGSRFPGVVLDDKGEALCATSGVVLVSSKRSLQEMLESLKTAKVDDTMGTPDKKQISGVVDSALRIQKDLRTVSIVSKDTPPNDQLKKIMESRRAERAMTISEKIAKIEKKISSLVAAKRTDGSIGSARDSLAVQKRLFRENQHEDTPMDHGFCVGEAAFDLRLIKKALKAMDSSTGTIYVAGEYDAAIFDAGSCSGLVMPFRKG